MTNIHTPKRKIANIDAYGIGGRAPSAEEDAAFSAYLREMRAARTPEEKAAATRNAETRNLAARKRRWAHLLPNNN